MQQQSSIRNANLLYLGTIILVLLLGAPVQGWHAGWGLIFTELVCILLPTLLVLRREGAAWAEALAWRPASLSETLLAIPVGLGCWALGVLLTIAMIGITGYEAPGVPAPQAPGAAAVLLVAMTLFAPVCEEILFRGYLYRAYSALGPRTAVVATALLFAFYHLRLQGLPGLLPAAFALTLIRRRTGSIRPAIVAHAVQNAASMGVMLLPAAGLSESAPWLAGGLLLLTVLGVAGLIWLMRLARGAEEAPAPPRPARAWSQAWPLIPFAAIYLFSAAWEAGLLPAATQPLPADPPALTAAAREQPEVWEYEIRNVEDEVVGSAECRLIPENSSYEITCREWNRAWRVERGDSVYQSDEANTETVIRWSRPDLRLLEMTHEVVFAADGSRLTASVVPVSEGLLLTVALDGVEQRKQVLPPGAVLEEEWPWRMALARLTEEQSLDVALGLPGKWDPRLRRQVAAVEPARITLTRGEGEWQARLGNQTAWYSAEAPHVLLRRDHFGHSYRWASE